MRRRMWMALLGLLLLPIVGSGRLLWRSLTVLISFPPKTLLVLVGLGVALSMPSRVTEQLASAGIWPPRHMISLRLARGGGAGGVCPGLPSASPRRVGGRRGLGKRH